MVGAFPWVSRREKWHNCYVQKRNCGEPSWLWEYLEEVKRTGMATNSGSSQEKPKIVVVMGAGASADFGVPTLRSIFKDPQADAYLKRDEVLHDWLLKTFWGPRGHSVATSDQSITVEEMLTV